MAFIKHDQANFFPDIGTIYRKVITNGPLGHSETYSLIASAPCRIAPIGDRKSESIYQEDVKNEVQTIEYLHVGTFPQNTDIDMIDRVVISGKTFEVTAMLTRQSFETAKRVMLIRVLS